MSLALPALGNLSGEAIAVWPEGYGLVSVLSAGKLPSHPTGVLELWDTFLELGSSWEPSYGESPALEFLLAPSPTPSQVFAIGLNYRDHAVEAGYIRDEVPQVFTKFPSCLVGPVSQVPVTSPRLDFEVELVVVIGRSGRSIKEAHAWSHVGGLMVGQDLSARDLQLTGTHPQWSLGKSLGGYGPVGPWITPLGNVADPNDLELSCQLNGIEMQSDRTSSMIFSVPELIERISRYCELRVGDLIFTGTPSGVGNRRTPPVYLQPGDVLESTISGCGSIVSRFVEA